jgi:hypothetical protein
MLDVLEIVLAFTAGVLFGIWIQVCQCDMSTMNSLDRIEQHLEELVDD